MNKLIGEYTSNADALDACMELAAKKMLMIILAAWERGELSRKGLADAVGYVFEQAADWREEVRLETIAAARSWGWGVPDDWGEPGIPEPLNDLTGITLEWAPRPRPAADADLRDLDIMGVA